MTHTTILNNGVPCPFIICFLLCCSEAPFNRSIEPIPLFLQICTFCTSKESLSQVTSYSVDNILVWEANEHISRLVNHQARFVWVLSFLWIPAHCVRIHASQIIRLVMDGSWPHHHAERFLKGRRTIKVEKKNLTIRPLSSCVSLYASLAFFAWSFL